MACDGRSVPRRLARPRLPLVPRHRRRSSGSARRSTSSRSTTTSCRRRRNATGRGVGGETWEIHGGGFYRVEKYRVAPPTLPEPAALVQVGGLHHLAARLRALRRAVLRQRQHVPGRSERREPRRAEAVGISRSACSSSAGWSTTRSPAGREAQRPRARRVHAGARHRGTAFGVTHLFAARAAYLQVGAMIGTMDGGQRPLRDHPGAAGAGRGEGGGPRARSGRERARQAALDPQQLPDAARAVRDAQQPLLDHVRPPARLGDARLPDGDRRLGAPLLQPAPPGTHGLVDPGHRGARARRRRDLDPARRRAAPPSTSTPVPFAVAHAIVAQRCAVCHSAAPDRARLHRARRRGSSSTRRRRSRRRCS